jgi:hypothetical protein
MLALSLGNPPNTEDFRARTGKEWRLCYAFGTEESRWCDSAEVKRIPALMRAIPNNDFACIFFSSQSSPHFSFPERWHKQLHPCTPLAQSKAHAQQKPRKIDLLAPRKRPKLRASNAPNIEDNSFFAKVTQISVVTPAKNNLLRPVALTALLNPSFSMALTMPGRLTFIVCTF